MASEMVTLGGGCFWCLEAVFQELRGVDSVLCRYADGKVRRLWRTLPAAFVFRPRQ